MGDGESPDFCEACDEPRIPWNVGNFLIYSAALIFSDTELVI
jgi:hypothetical protein